MEKQTHPLKFRRQRKFFMILPLLVLPFITLMFWALGGGKTNSVNAEGLSQKGFNMQLPDAYLKDRKPLDKLRYYEKLASDSAKLKEQIKNDPYYRLEGSNTAGGTGEEALSSHSSIKTSPYSSFAYQDSNEAKVYQKLDQLNKILRRPPVAQKPSADDVKAGGLHPADSGFSSGDIDRLEQMMQVMNQSDGQDPEMQQLNGMLEKILDIQHPQRVEEKLKQVSKENREKVFRGICQ